MIVLLGRKLQELREKQGLTQQKVADSIGVNRKQISAYENGIREPSLEILSSLAGLYRVSCDYLIRDRGSRNLDVRGLTDQEEKIIQELIDVLSEKNKQLEGR